MNGICDDNNSIYIRKTGSLINTASYSEKFSFSKYDDTCIMYNLDDWIVVTMNIED